MLLPILVRRELSFDTLAQDLKLEDLPVLEASSIASSLRVLWVLADISRGVVTLRSLSRDKQGHDDEE